MQTFLLCWLSASFGFCFHKYFIMNRAQKLTGLNLHIGDVLAWTGEKLIPYYSVPSEMFVRHIQLQLYVDSLKQLPDMLQFAKNNIRIELNTHGWPNKSGPESLEKALREIVKVQKILSRPGSFTVGKLKAENEKS